MKNYFSSDFKLGVLGGGQLGRMLLSETQKFDIYTCILDLSPQAPCAQICNEFHQGDLLDFDTVYLFGKKVDLLTIEIENVNIDALDRLEKEGLTIYPKPKDLRIIQNKATQKNFYKDNNIPTAEYSHYAYLEELKHSYHNNAIEFPFVWKAARFGYDGNGVKIVRNFEDLENLPTGECIVEKLIPFKNELAVIVARNKNGEVISYPVVEMEFHPEANQVEYVICPARIEEKVAEKDEESFEPPITTNPGDILLRAITKEGENPLVEKLIDAMQHLTKTMKIRSQKDMQIKIGSSRGGPAGMVMCRMAFAVLLKMSGFLVQLQSLLDEFEF